MPDEDLTPTFIVGLPLARDALVYARELHRGQHRDSDYAPFILHPLEVAALLHNTGHPQHVVAAAILHDTLEDTNADPENITTRFGPLVAELVGTMTENPWPCGPRRARSPKASRCSSTARPITPSSDN